MKKIVAMLLAAVMLLALCACASNGGAQPEAAEEPAAQEEAQPAAPAAEEAAETEPAEETAEEPAPAEEAEPETITIRALDANQEETDVTVPYDPQRIAILDLAALDILDSLGLGDRVVGMASTSIDYLSRYAEDPEIENLGNVKEADMEAVMACEPDIIFIGGRLSRSYDQFEEIAPVVLLTTDTELGLVESIKKNATTIASIFGLEDEIGEKLDGYDARIAALNEAAAGQSAVIGMVTSGSFNMLGNTGRLSLIVNEIGFENVGADLASENERGGRSSGEASGEASAEPAAEGNAESAGGDSTPHGEETSFELLLQLDPTYVFVLDRDSAIGTQGAQLAADIMDNELVAETDAAQNGNVIILEHPAVWYTAEGGITALDYMLSDMESVLLG